MDVTFVFKTVIDVAFAVILCAWAIAVARLTKNGQIENVLKTSEEIAKVAAVVVKAANELDITGELIKTGKTKAEYALEEAKKTLASKGITFDEDELITYIKAAPMGDPIEYRIWGYELTLRKDDGAKIEVELVEKREGKKESI